MNMSIFARFPHLIGAGTIVALACGLYVPFLGNPPVFDDQFLFSGQRFLYYATHPFGLELRVPPYFSFAVVQVLSGDMETHRILSLAFHIACSLALYKLLYDLLRAVRRPDPLATASGKQSQAATWACIGAAAFAVHPVAVYGAGYLVQRTIVLATLFSLLSLIVFVRGLERRRHADAISAALMFSIAVLCKEHSVLLPAVAVLAVPLLSSDRRFGIRYAVLYLSACAPAAIFVALLAKGVIGKVYEPEFGSVTAQIGGSFGDQIVNFPWSMSAATQAGLFFKYLSLWLWPDTRAMSVDLRVDFLETWSPGWIALKISAFAAFGALSFLFLRRRGRVGLVGFGMLYTWVLFLVELSAPKIQEPFVLYRSYLWAPGIVLALAALLNGVPRRAALAAFSFVCAALLYQAHDRLVTFSSPLALWKDAIAKFPDKPVPWGSRILFNLARAYAYDGQLDKAGEVVERCLAQYPDTYDCYFARGAIYLQTEEFDLARTNLDRAISLKPESGIAHHRLGIVFENLGRIEDAKAFYRRASELGYKGADQEISRLESPGRGLLPPGKRTPAPRTTQGAREMPSS
jgi:tetratricopeptide (TPR) repeat protein